MYWLVAAIGIFSIDCLDMHFDVDIDGITPDVPANGLGGLLMKFGFDKVPMTLIISLISLIGWAISYLSTRYLLNHFSNDSNSYYIVSTVLFIVVLIISTLLTAWVIKPLRPFFSKLNGGNNHRTLLGQIVEIRTGTVSSIKGEALYEDGGAGLILQVRADERNQFRRGDKVVLLSYDATNNSYEVMSIDEFNGH